MKIRLTGSVYKEVLIIVLVIGGFATLAYPAFCDYLRRDYYKAVVQAADSLKDKVEKCHRHLQTFIGCNAGTQGIPPAMNKPKGAVASVTVVDGVITAAPVAKDGIQSTDTYILTPKVMNEELTWTPSGAGIKQGFAN